MAESLRIVRLYAQNFKALRVVDVRPQGNVVRITGANGAGKSSVLDSIWAALGGSKAAPSQPVRKGMPEALIEIDLGEYKVTRRFTLNSKQPPIVVEAADGTRFKSPQDLLDKMLGDLTFDPLAFARMKPEKQAEELRRIANLGPELDELDRLNDIDYEARSQENRRAKEASALADAIRVPADLPVERANVAMLAEQLDEAGKYNANIDKRKMGRAVHLEKAIGMRDRAAKLAASLPAEVAQIEKRRDDRIDELMRQIEALKRQVDGDLRNLKESRESDVRLMQAEADVIEKRLADAEPLGEPKDVLLFKEQIAMAQTTNSGIDLRDRREEKLREANAALMAAEKLTDDMKSRSKRKAEIIGAAKMPVPDLSLDGGAVTYRGLPFEQASSAEQLRVSTAIAMAQNPTLRILRIEDGSLLDSKSWEVLEEMCDANNFQAWVEQVDESGKIGVVMDDGSVVADNQLAAVANGNDTEGNI